MVQCPRGPTPVVGPVFSSSIGDIFVGKGNRRSPSGETKIPSTPQRTFVPFPSLLFNPNSIYSIYEKKKKRTQKGSHILVTSFIEENLFFYVFFFWFPNKKKPKFGGGYCTSRPPPVLHSSCVLRRWGWGRTVQGLMYYDVKTPEILSFVSSLHTRRPGPGSGREGTGDLPSIVEGVGSVRSGRGREVRPRVCSPRPTSPPDRS